MMLGRVPTRSLARLLGSAALASAWCALLFAGPTPATAGTGCAYAGVSPVSAEDLVRAERATRCLVNRERRRRGLRALHYNRDLGESSAWQAGDMAAYGYFGHQRDGGPSFAGRITRFGYGADGSFTIGENIAWASDGGATPRDVVRMWMRSPGHRKNILRRSFKEQALAALHVDGNQVGGDFAGAGPLVIYVNQFGARY